MNEPLPCHRTRLTRALRELLRVERELTAAGAERLGWAEARTREIDAALTPAMALVELAMAGNASVAPPPKPPVLSALPATGRPIYRPLAAYALARSGWAGEELLHEARRCADPRSAVGVWWALTLQTLTGDDAALRKLLDGQRPTGEFFDSSPYDSPDLHWYDELVVLHAAATFACHTGIGQDAVLRAARFHTAETQPDHATTQPWALHAFAVDDDTYPLAELLLHGALAQNAGRLDRVAQLLLSDSILALDAYAGRRGS